MFTFSSFTTLHPAPLPDGSERNVGSNWLENYKILKMLLKQGQNVSTVTKTLCRDKSIIVNTFIKK